MKKFLCFGFFFMAVMVCPQVSRAADCVLAPGAGTYEGIQVVKPSGAERYWVKFGDGAWARVSQTQPDGSVYFVVRRTTKVSVTGYKGTVLECENLVDVEYTILQSAPAAKKVKKAEAPAAPAVVPPAPAPAAPAAEENPKVTEIQSGQVGRVSGQRLGEVYPTISFTQCKNGREAVVNPDHTWSCQDGEEPVNYDIIRTDQWLSDRVTRTERHEAREHGFLAAMGIGSGLGTAIGAGVCGVASIATGGLAVGVCLPALGYGAGGGAAAGAIVEGASR